MAEIQINIEINGTLDEEILAEEVKNQLRKEIDKLKRKFAEEELAEKWAKIGRKPNQLKTGDLVLRAPGCVDVVVDPIGGLRLADGEELLVPVENRFYQGAVR